MTMNNYKTTIPTKKNMIWSNFRRGGEGGGGEDYPALFKNQRKKKREEKITNQ